MQQAPEWFEVKVETAIRSRLSTAQREALINASDEDEAFARQAAIARVVGALQIALDLDEGLDEGLDGGFFRMSSSSSWRSGHWTAP